MRVLVVALGLCLTGCYSDPDSIPGVVVEAFGDTAKIDAAMHRRLLVIEQRLDITPPAEDVKDIEELSKALEANKVRNENAH